MESRSLLVMSLRPDGVLVVHCKDPLCWCMRGLQVDLKTA